MTEPLRAGLIGMGAMGRNHARVLNALDGVDLVAVSDPVASASSLPSGVDLVKTVEDPQHKPYLKGPLVDSLKSLGHSASEAQAAVDAYYKVSIQ